MNDKYARKMLTDMPLLDGQSETISLSDFRAAPGDVIAQAQIGKTFTLTKNGRPIATLSKYEPNALELGAAVRRLNLVGAA